MAERVGPLEGFVAVASSDQLLQSGHLCLMRFLFWVEHSAPFENG